jgi:hypothetical protein
MKNRILLAAVGSAVALTAVVGIAVSHRTESRLAVAAGSTSEPATVQAESASAGDEDVSTTTTVASADADSTKQIIADHEKRIGILEATTKTTTAVTGATDPTTATTTSTTSPPPTTVTTTTMPISSTTTTTVLAVPSCSVSVSLVEEWHDRTVWEAAVSSNRPRNIVRVSVAGDATGGSSSDLLLDASGAGRYRFRRSQTDTGNVAVSFDGEEVCSSRF